MCVVFFVLYIPSYICLCCIFLCFIFHVIYFMLYFSWCIISCCIVLNECYITLIGFILFCTVIRLSFFNCFPQNCLKIFQIYSNFQVCWCCICFVVFVLLYYSCCIVCVEVFILYFSCCMKLSFLNYYFSILLDYFLLLLS